MTGNLGCQVMPSFWYPERDSIPCHSFLILCKIRPLPFSPNSFHFMKLSFYILIDFPKTVIHSYLSKVRFPRSRPWDEVWVQVIYPGSTPRWVGKAGQRRGRSQARVWSPARVWSLARDSLVLVPWGRSAVGGAPQSCIPADGGLSSSCPS